MFVILQRINDIICTLLRSLIHVVAGPPDTWRCNALDAGYEDYMTEQPEDSWRRRALAARSRLTSCSVSSAFIGCM